jgi:hypothetical protein
MVQLKLSHEKVVHLSHVLAAALDKAEGVNLNADRNDVRLEIVKVLRQELRKEADIDLLARAKIMTQKKDIPEGSEEWEIMFRKYYEEELSKLRNVQG